VTPATFKYHAFISYSHADRGWAAWLHRAIETYRVPKRLVSAGAAPRLAPVFRDREELPSANNLGEKIEAALTASQRFIVICSPRAAQSRWVNEEITRFKALGRRDQIYCLIVAGEPHAIQRGCDPSLECFPAALLAGPDDIEPIAADVRPGGDGKNQAKLKVIAGMLGVGLDELRRRDLQRRNRRLVWFSTASIAGILITTGLAAFAWIARNEAEANRLLAQREAQTARQTTQFMVGLFNVVDPGEARGRSVTAYEILERGVGTIRHDLVDQPEVQATLMQTMGKVFTGLGLYQRSVELLEEAFRTRGAVTTIETAETQVALADALYLKGDYDAAEQRYRETLRVLSAQSWSVDRSGAANGLADVLAQKNDFDAAIALYRDTLEHDLATWGALDIHTARTYNGLATAQLYAHDTPGADITYQRTLEAYRAALGPDHPRVAETINNLAAVRYFSGDPAGAVKYYRDAVPMFRKLYGNVHPNVSTILNNLGRIELERRQIDAALPLLQESVAIDRKLGRADHDDFVFALGNLALANRASGDLSTAAHQLAEAAALAARHEHRMLGPILADETDVQCSTGHADDAAERLDAAAQQIERFYPDERWRMAILESVRGQCLSASGDRDAGERLLLDSLPVIEAKWGKDALFTYDARARIAAHYERAGNAAVAQRYRAI
jgi:tetratricopeptide (TPR) repeat protein